MKKPLVVYISGAPGSGKTTLGRLLSEQIYIPSISSDLIHGGVAFSNPDHDRQSTLLDVFVPSLIGLSQKGVSYVVDQVLQEGVSETSIIDKLRPYATIINIHTVCSNPIERYKERIQASESPVIIQRSEHLLKRAEYHASNLNRTSQPLKLDLPLLVVQTDDGYNPKLSEIVDFIKKSYAERA